MDLYFLKYNNYFNRTYKREEYLLQYLFYRVAEVEDCDLWNPNDGITATQVFEYEPVKEFPDYMVVGNGGEIVSRWFVMDGTRLRDGQYKVNLRRDVIADHIDQILNSPMLIERALLPETDNLIFNSEDIVVNQIKTSELLIKDVTQVPWIVGYIAQKADATFNKVTGLTSYTRPNQTAAGLENFPYWANTNYGDHSATPYKGIPARYDVQFNFIWSKNYGINNIKRVKFEVEPGERAFVNDLGRHQTIIGYYAGADAVGPIPDVSSVNTAFKDSTKWYSEIIAPYNFPSTAELEAFTRMDGQIVQDTTTGKYYKYTLKRTRTVERLSYNSTEVKSKFTNVNNIIHTELGASTNSPIGEDMFGTVAAYFNYTLQLEDYTQIPTYEYTISTSRKHLKDAPYDMIAIPYGTFNNLGSKELAFDIAAQTISQNTVGTTGNIYDFQILPYCPLKNWSISALTDGVDYTPVKDSKGTILTYVYYCDQSSFSKTIFLKEPIGVDNKKLNNICDKYRLVSPNYAGQFEFTAAANNGISGFTVNCTYQPINPYIRVAPLFGGLYGGEFGDARGLICGGDFSLPVVNDAWISYQQSNKNYQAIFDRQIKNMEFSNDINRKMELINAITGIFSGAASGGVFGTTFGGLGAGLGAGAGALASGLGAIADLRMNEQIRQEQMKYTKDLFKLNLANIQAQPYSLSKTTAFTANNKIFPVLEYFTCTQREKDAVAAQIIQFSMNVGVVGELKDYINNTWQYKGNYARNYIKGQFTKLNDLSDDFHVAQVINQELQGGLYFDEYSK